MISWVEGSFKSVERRRMTTCRFGLERNSNYYLINIISVIFIVVEFGSFTVAIDCTDFGTRSSVTITLLLTLIAFKFVVISYVPVVPYPTLLDRYTFFGTLMLGIIILENFLVSSLFHPNASPIVSFNDQAFAVAWNIIWISSHLLLVVAEKYSFLRQDWESIKRRDKLLEESVAKQFKGCNVVEEATSDDGVADNNINISPLYSVKE
jgi:hypothetical protein